VDDPKRRCPDVTVAERELQWKATVPLAEALRATIDWWQLASRPSAPADVAG
jgi:dTDP-glucose 4,6-dehydratase